MKRQVAIKGPTPEFVRWSIRQSCALRQDLQLDSIDATEKRLRAIRIAGHSVDRGDVYQGIAYTTIKGRAKAFRLSEVFDVFGGIENVRNCCSDCSANALNQLPQYGSLAGCHGWLPRIDGQADDVDLAQQLQQIVIEGPEELPADLFLPTRFVWNSVWANRILAGDSLNLAKRLFDRVRDRMPDSAAVADFCQVLNTCDQHNIKLDVELIPAGFSDGLRWTVGRHCDQCRAAFDPEKRYCEVCSKSGMGHPEIHRKVRGLRPWVDLEVVVGTANVDQFLRDANLKLPNSE